MKPRHKSIETKFMEDREEFFRSLRRLDRRSFIKLSTAALGAVAVQGLVPPNSFQPVTLATGPTMQGAGNAFRIAYISDSHLYEKDVNDRFVRALMRAVDDVNALDPQPDFVFYGGDLAQLGQPKELELGAGILKNLKAPLKIMVGEHDWFLDMGEKWRALFGEPTYSWDHKGIHFVTLLSVAADYTSPAGIVVDASGDLTILGAGATGWLILDVLGFNRIKLQASANVAGATSASIFAGGA